MQYERLKRRIYNVIRTDDENVMLSNIFNGFIILLILANVTLVILDTFDSLPDPIKRVSSIMELFSIVVFSIEYLLRIWTADLTFPSLPPIKARIKYMFSFMAIIDLLAILPFYLPYVIPIDLRVLRMIRLLRLMRILKVNRYTNALSAIGGVIKKKAQQLISSMVVGFLLMLIASILMYNLEHEAQPGVFLNAFSGLW